MLQAGANTSTTQVGNTLTIHSVGTLTGVTAGAGLLGGGTSGNPTLSFNSGVVQTRATGSCAAGSAVRGINPDGSVICDTLPGRLITILQGDISGANGVSGYRNFFTNHVAAVNERVLIHSRCSFDAPSQMSFRFRNAIRHPTGGAVTVGDAYYLWTQAGPGWASFNANVDGFDLLAGNSYDFGISFSPASPAAYGQTDYCSMIILVFSR